MATATFYTINRNPREHSDWRKHRYACPNYRERWFPDSEPELGEPMYQVFCLMGTPPETNEEQEKCFNSRCKCWRIAEQERAE